MKYVIIDILRNKIVLAYTIFLLLLSFMLFGLEDNTTKGLLGLLNILLIIVPMICIVFSTIYIYNSAEFIELLVSQPLTRSRIWLSLFAGMAFSLSLAFLIGAGIPLLIFVPDITGITMLFTGLLLSIIFIAIALLASVKTRDKAKGIGVAILLWLYFSLLFDGIVLFLLFQFADYPMEKPMILISTLNPIDLGRILILLKMDIAALLGYTGAVFQQFFGTLWGQATSFIILLLWTLIPLWISVRRFNHKDL
ncbi:Cu-processing system permease protein [Sediminibacterium goheungense]|uniref:Cu-processing system permease protein n=2 Tax=Sediminibacterium goheungense TaxID=1086393 RepID=A0A4V3C4M9_9BACT|nr:Cu-processing system permease protein [Sediminibacterium goheungense]